MTQPHDRALNVLGLAIIGAIIALVVAVTLAARAGGLL